MISASAWSSRWAAGTASLLLVGGSALPGVEVLPDVVDPAPATEVLPEVTGPDPAPVVEPSPEEPAPDPVPEEPAAPGEEPIEQPLPDAPHPPAVAPPVVDRPITDRPVPKPEETEPVSAGPVLVVVPEPVRALVDGAPGYLLPLGSGGFTWLVDGVRVDELPDAAALVKAPDAGWYELSAVALGVDAEQLVLAVVAESGHVLLGTDGSTSEVRSVVDPRLPAELALPTALDGAGREDAVVVPDVATQVVRDAAGEVVEPGTHPVTAEYVDGVAVVALTVTAAAGHRLEVDGVPVESVPGAGDPWSTTVELTDVPVEQPAPPLPAPPVTVPVEPLAAPEADEQPAPVLQLAAPVLTVTAAPEPPAVEAVTQPVETVEQLPDPQPEGLGLIVMLGGLLLGGSWLVLGMRGD